MIYPETGQVYPGEMLAGLQKCAVHPAVIDITKSDFTLVAYEKMFAYVPRVR